MCWFISHADEMKNGGRLKYICQQNANPDNKMSARLWKRRGRVKDT